MDINALETKEEFLEYIAQKELEGHLNFMQEQQRKVENYKTLNRHARKGQILFTGSSLMEQFPICDFCQCLPLDKKVYNRGIGGYTTDDFLREIDAMLFDLEPSKVFINIGTNDMREREDGTDWKEHLLGNYKEILKKVKERLPEAELYLMAYYPVNTTLPHGVHPDDPFVKVRTLANLAMINEEVEKLAKAHGYHFIDVNDGLADENGNLKEEFTIEGVHMIAAGYEIVFENIKGLLQNI